MSDPFDTLSGGFAGKSVRRFRSAVRSTFNVCVQRRGLWRWRDSLRHSLPSSVKPHAKCYYAPAS